MALINTYLIIVLTIDLKQDVLKKKRMLKCLLLFNETIIAYP